MKSITRIQIIKDKPRNKSSLKTKPITKGLERLTVLGLSILSKLTDAHPKKYRTVSGERIKFSSQRYVVFQKSVTCCKCGIEGQYFGAERSRGSRKDKTFHLNLYALKPDGTEVLMTKDHIIPKSKGGLDEHNNYQTMCTHCNSKKGNKMN